MTRRLILSAVLILAIPTFAGAQVLTATLSGASEVPGPGDIDGSGYAVITLEGTTLHYSLFAQNISTVIGAHIHTGAAGSSGGILVDLSPSFSGSAASGSVSIDASTAADIIADPAGFYVNVHSTEFGGGAIRGQLTASFSTGGTLQYFPVTVNSPGVNNTFFVSDARLLNGGTSAAVVMLEFFPASLSGVAGPSKTAAVQVAAGDEAILDDVVAQQFQASGLGAVRISSTQPVQAIVRNVNDLRSAAGGVLGYAYEAMEPTGAKTSGTLLFLSNASESDRAAGAGFRTNVGFFNPTPESITVTFSAFTNDGTFLGSRTVTAASFQMFQQGAFQLLNSVPVENQAQSEFYITYTASAPLFVWATVADNKNGDGIFVD